MGIRARDARKKIDTLNDLGIDRCSQCVFTGSHSCTLLSGRRMGPLRVPRGPILRVPGKGQQAHWEGSEWAAHEVVFRRFAVADETVIDHASQILSTERGRNAATTHLELASLTRMRGRAKSSRSRWLCSSTLLSFSSDMACLPPARVLILSVVQAGVKE
jgi:hypothetical protein